MTTAVTQNGHHHQQQHGLQYLGAVVTLIGTLVAIGGAFATVTYQMGRLSQRVDQLEKQASSVDEHTDKYRDKVEFRLTVLERKVMSGSGKE